MRRYHVIAEPFISEHNYAEQCKALEQQYSQRFAQQNANAKSVADSMPLSKIKESPPLQIMINKYVATVGESNYSVSEDEDDNDSGVVFDEDRHDTRDKTDTITTSTAPQPGEPVFLHHTNVNRKMQLIIRSILQLRLRKRRSKGRRGRRKVLDRR